MIAWKLGAKSSSSFCTCLLLPGLALPAVASATSVDQQLCAMNSVGYRYSMSRPLAETAQNYDPQNGPTKPWSDSSGAQNQPLGQYQSLGSANQSEQYGQGAAEWRQGTQPYSAPPGGYSPSFSYEQPVSTFSPANLPLWNAPAAAPRGIISSHMQPPALPEGLVLPVQLDTSIDTEKAEPGDYIQTHLSQNISAGGSGYLPGASVISGTICQAPEEKHFGHAGKISINFEQVRLPNGTLVPMKAHLVGRIANYIYRDTNPRSNSLMSTAWRDGVGSGLSSGMGSGFAVASGGGAGPGAAAFAGAFAGGASSLLSNMFYHHHNDIFLHPGTRLELQLDAPLVLPGAMGNNNSRYLPGTGPNTGIFIIVPVIDCRLPSVNELRRASGAHYRAGAR